MDPNITCPNCKTVFPLTETLARPLIEAERQKVQQEAQQRAAALQQREYELNQKRAKLNQLEKTLNDRQTEIDQQVEARLQAERDSLTQAVTKQASAFYVAKLQAAEQALAERDAKLAQAEEAELEARHQREALEREKRSLELTINRRMDQEREKVRQQAIQEQSELFQAKVAEQERALAEKEEKLAQAEEAELEARRQREALETEKRNLDLTITRRLDQEREKVRQHAIQEQSELFQAQLAEQDRALTEKDAKLAEAQRAELEVRKERQALEQQKRELEVQIERQLDEERHKIREATQKEEADSHRLKLAEKDKVIDDMRKQVEELRRKSEQGSQQLQGEVQEIELEELLRAEFPLDQIEPVQVGRPGSDVVHTVIGPNGLQCGKILWESKRAKNWNDDWLAKNRDDQRAARAHLGVIVTATLPKAVDSFDRIENVWVTGIRCALPLARALRQTLTQTAMAHVAAQGRDGKMERMYSYVTEQSFRQRVGAIVESYVTLRADLDAEKRSLTKYWAKREKQLELLIAATAGMYGDFQGIVGKSMPEIEGLELPALGAQPSDQEAA